MRRLLRLFQPRLMTCPEVTAPVLWDGRAVARAFHNRAERRCSPSMLLFCGAEHCMILFELFRASVAQR